MTSIKNIASRINEMTKSVIRQELVGLTITKLQQLARETKTSIPRDKRRKTDMIEIFVNKFAVVETEDVAAEIAEEAENVEENIVETQKTAQIEESKADEIEDGNEITQTRISNNHNVNDVRSGAQISALIISSIAVLFSILFCKVEAMPAVLILSKSIILLAAVMLIVETPDDVIESKFSESKTKILEVLASLINEVPARITRWVVAITQMLHRITDILSIVDNKIVAILDYSAASDNDSVIIDSNNSIDYSVFEKFLSPSYLHLETL